ncbi:MAG: protein kinase [Proteobacteria bacterium]|nr:protein kinase [Pseudomonadota bacterium]
MSVPDQLQRFADLLDRGLITREEFEEQKERVLAQARATPTASGRWAIAQPNLAEGPVQLGAYELTTQLGFGGMGTVYRGRHVVKAAALKQGGEVAVKVMHPQFCADPEFRERFKREAELGMRLDHPAIVKVLDLIIDGPVLALVLELVEGRSLLNVDEDGHARPLDPAEALRLFEQVAAGVAYAHSCGVIHRDIKPDNVLVGTSGVAKILDFGIAKDVDGSVTVTQGRGALGSGDYMAPEQHHDASSIDFRADIYALGMTMYHVAAGELPFGSQIGAAAVMATKLLGTVETLALKRPNLPPALVAVVDRAMAKDPDDRFQTAEALHTAIVGALIGVGGAEPPVDEGLAAEDSLDRPLVDPTDVAADLDRAGVPALDPVSDSWRGEDQLESSIDEDGPAPAPEVFPVDHSSPHLSEELEDLDPVPVTDTLPRQLLQDAAAKYAAIADEGESDPADAPIPDEYEDEEYAAAWRPRLLLGGGAVLFLLLGLVAWWQLRPPPDPKSELATPVPEAAVETPAPEPVTLLEAEELDEVEVEVEGEEPPTVSIAEVSTSAPTPEPTTPRATPKPPPKKDSGSAGAAVAADKEPTVSVAMRFSPPEKRLLMLDAPLPLRVTITGATDDCSVAAVYRVRGGGTESVRLSEGTAGTWKGGITGSNIMGDQLRYYIDAVCDGVRLRSPAGTGVYTIKLL